MVDIPKWGTEAYPSACPMCGEGVYLRDLRAPGQWGAWPMDRAGKNHLASCEGFQGWISGSPGLPARNAFKKWISDAKAEAELNPRAFVDKDEALRKMKGES